MKYLIITAIGLISLACAQTIKMGVQIPVEMDISPGEVRFVEFPLPQTSASFSCRGNPVKYVNRQGKGYAYVMESYFSDLTSYSCKVETQGVTFYEIKFNVKEREYPAEQLKVDPKKIALSPKDQKRVYEEQLVLNKIYASSVPDFLYSEAFQQPLKSHVTSIYGTKRVYNKKKKGQHLGIDYRAAIGDKVPSANAGKIVFAGDLFYTGWTVIIDHGLDIFTVYGHLSKTLVKEGQIIKRGDVIGLSGNTGRTSGPHLHWGTKVQGQYIDGFVLISESSKFFKP